MVSDFVTTSTSVFSHALFNRMLLAWFVYLCFFFGLAVRQIGRMLGYLDYLCIRMSSYDCFFFYYTVMLFRIFVINQ